MKHYWLMKSEPSCFSIDDLKNAPAQKSPWDGVRNYQARNFMLKDMKIGDLVYFYHSNATPPGIAGVARIASSAYPDFTAFDPTSEHPDPKSTPDNPRWYMVDVEFVEKFQDIIPLETLKQHPPLQDMQLLKKGNRLSILPISESHWHYIYDVLKP